MDTDEMVRMAKEREGWHTSVHKQVPAVLDENKHLVACNIGKENAVFTANAPRTILALAEEVAAANSWGEAAQNELLTLSGEYRALADEVARLQARCAELEAQGTRRKEHFSDSDVLPLKTLSECTGVSVYALRAACYRGAIKYWKINNNQHYASTIAEVRRYKRRSSPDQP